MDYNVYTFIFLITDLKINPPKSAKIAPNKISNIVIPPKNIIYLPNENFDMVNYTSTKCKFQAIS